MIPFRGVLIILFVFLNSPFARSQFYAPDTVRHDPVQRFFPVELARAMAWYENGKFPSIAEIKYRVSTRNDGTTHWDLQWMDAKGKPVFTTTIDYPAALLEKGPEFYRTVASAVAKPNWQRRFRGITSERLTANYWKGAAELGLSREETFGHILKIADGFENDETLVISQLAGALTHSALFNIADRLTIDSMTAARGAAWLAFAERTSAGNRDELWAPTLFLGGRERQADELWQKTHPSKLSDATVAETGWNIFLRKPKSKDLYGFALETNGLAMGLPMLAYDAQVTQNGELWVETMLALRDLPTLERMHNFEPVMTWEAFTAGRMLEGAFCFFQRRDWVNLMNQFKGGSNEFNGYREAAAAADKFFAQRPKVSQADENSLIGLKETAPLINMGHDEGTGPLIPTASLTARDLLNYGWEMTGLQMGSRYRFVEFSWGVHDLAATIRSHTVAEVQGLLPFFVNEDSAKSATYRETLARLQLVDRLFLRSGWSVNPFGGGARNTKIFMERAWLRPREMEWQVRSLWDENDFSSINEVFNAHLAAGGPLAASFALNYLGAINREGFAQLTNGPTFSAQFAERLPYIPAKHIRAIYPKVLQGRDPFDRAQICEKMYWENPESGLEDRIFRDYAAGGAFRSARRFYKQARPFIKELSPISVSNGLGPNAYITGHLIGDVELRHAALEDSASGSHNDMALHIFEDVLNDDLKQLRTDVNDMVERYGEGKPGNHPDLRLQAFLPLIPALKDPKHKQHDEALRFFSGTTAWPVFRWLCVEQFKLSKEDGIRFLGGRDADLFQRGLVAYLEQDHTGMLNFVNRYNARGVIDLQVILLQTLFDRLEGNKFTREQPDLKPKNVESLRSFVREKLAKRASAK